jgi:NADPH-dependent curcumin reductase CurA
VGESEVAENRYWRLDAHPVGNDFAAALSLQAEAVPQAGAGQVVVRNEWLSMDAGTRMWMTPRTDGYQPPLPLGSKMVGVVLGRIAASGHAGFAVGDLVRGFGQWADYSIVEPEAAGLLKLNEEIADPREWLGALGLNGWTVYAGLVEVAKVKAGETVLVSAAAGATGSLACQVARNLGARVIGIAGGAEKCLYLQEALGVERTIDYKSADVAATLAQLPGGINVYFDNVGGPMLDDVFVNMAHYGRIAVCGLVSSYDRDEPAPGPRHFDQILMRRLTVAGFFLPDFLDRAAGYTPVLRRWHEEGRLTTRFDETAGLANTLVAYERMLSGRNIGKVIVDVRG